MEHASKADDSPRKARREIVLKFLRSAGISSCGANLLASALEVEAAELGDPWIEEQGILQAALVEADLGGTLDHVANRYGSFRALLEPVLGGTTWNLNEALVRIVRNVGACLD
jgi:hypothetical protein